MRARTLPSKFGHGSSRSCGTRVSSKNQAAKGKNIEHTAMKNLIPILISAVALSLSSARAADAKATYEKDCAKCHGPDGKGETKTGKKLGVKDYTDPKVQAELKDDAGFKAIKAGLKDKDDKVQMKPLDGATDDEIKALVAYMRTFKK